MIFKRVVHIEIIPKDPQKSIDFFINVLGFKFKSRTEVKIEPMREVIFLELGDTVVEILSINAPKPKSETPWEVGYRALAIEVEDMAKAVDYLQGKGISLSVDPVDLGSSYRGEIRDPDGLIIELRQWK